MYLVLSEGFVENEQRVTVLLCVCLYAGGVVILSCQIVFTATTAGRDLNSRLVSNTLLCNGLTT